MADQQQIPAAPPLPEGWLAHWNAEYSRYVFTEIASGKSQWEYPQDQPQQAQANVAPPPAHRSKRQYAAGQDDYYLGGAASAPTMGHASSQSIGNNSQFNQPGFQQPQQPQFFSPAGGQPAAQAPYTGMQQPQQQPRQQQGGMPGPAPYMDGSQNLYGQQQTQQPYGQPGMNQMNQQFGQMGLGGQKPFPLQTINLINQPLNPAELRSQVPEINLPPNASFSNHPLKNADVSFQRSTLNAVPTTSSLLNKSKIPFALICTPYRSIKPGDEEVPVVSDTVIARCRRCRTYINPYVTFIEGGNRWKCSMCNLSNEVPSLFDWNQQANQPADRWQRAELNHAVVDFVAPTEYMVRPPQPPVYVFLIDVSYAAVHSGMVATAARTLLECLDRLPNEDSRTKICIIGFDTALHFFSLAPESTEPTMLVVGDLDDVFLPSPTDLLCNLTEARAGIESLVGRLNDMFKDTSNVGNALGAGLQAAFKLVSNIGGKIFCLSSGLPTLGPGALKSRDDPKLFGTSKESSLLQPATEFYKKLAIECSRLQVSVDMWLFGASYTDVATLSGLPKYTGGQTFLYPAFDASRSEDALKFAHEFSEVITSPILLEAVMRIRASKGLRMSAFHGNFFVRSTDLLALPAVPQDQSYAVEIQIEDPLSTPFVVFQTAVLHTTSFGERRIRVVTLALPTTSTMSEIFAGVDQIALVTFLANKAVERSLTAKLEDARDAIVNKLVEIFSVYKSTMTSAGQGASPQLVTSDTMKFLPLLLLGLLKHVGLRQSAQIPSDLRAYAQALLTTLPSQQLIPYLHPSFYALHNMPRECGTVGDDGVVMPPPLPLTSERLERHGLHLIEDGQNIFLWVGRDAVPQLIQDVFDLPAINELRGGKTTLPVLENSFSQRVNAIIGKVRESRRGPYYPHLYVCKEDGEPSLRMWALSALIEDRQEPAPSYVQFLQTIKDKVNGA